MTFEVILTPEESGGFTVSCPAIPGCFSEGDTEEEALANIREAIQGCLEVRRELGMSLDSIVRHVEV
ncbi:type II toxin-antitoxin system HicB family antitoxin [Alicyclobacillus sp. ALC3]|nr:type II toxin-antitoxin system HicB family antitoxin [Alicyclobacillus sp. ALC3]